MGMPAEILRRLADTIEDPRQMENVESCRRCPTFDQNLLLALNRTRKKEKAFILPDAASVIEDLRKVLIAVSTSDNQSAVLGIFYTNRSPTNRENWMVATGIFPLYGDITQYLLRPTVGIGAWQSAGYLSVTDRSTSGEDPFFAPNPHGPDFVFFKKNPFSEARPYEISLQANATKNYKWPDLKDQSLEANVIERALLFGKVRSTKPRIFREPGFDEFIRANRHDPKYAELYRVWRYKFRITNSDFSY